MSLNGTLQERVEHWFTQGAATVGNGEAEAAFLELRTALESGELRAAEPDDSLALGWRVNAWVKRGILLGFRLGTLVEMGSAEGLSFVDKGTYPARRFAASDGVRVVPGGSSVRAGAYVSKRVHLSAAAQIGGVLEPVNASPVIIEDDVLVGGNTGVYEGTVVRRRAVLAAGTVLTRGTPVYDLVRGEVYKATAEMPLVIPEGAVVVPGSRAVNKGKGQEWGLSISAPVIVKYRDEKTELSLVLEDILR